MTARGRSDGDTVPDRVPVAFSQVIRTAEKSLDSGRPDV